MLVKVAIKRRGTRLWGAHQEEIRYTGWKCGYTRSGNRHQRTGQAAIKLGFNCVHLGGWIVIASDAEQKNKSVFGLPGADGILQAVRAVGMCPPQPEIPRFR